MVGSVGRWMRWRGNTWSMLNLILRCLLNHEFPIVSRSHRLI